MTQASFQPLPYRKLLFPTDGSWDSHTAVLQLVPLALANLMMAGLVGRITFELQRSYEPGSIQASPLFVLFGFTLGNLILVILFAVLTVLWRNGRRGAQLSFDVPAEAAA